MWDEKWLAFSFFFEYQLQNCSYPLLILIYRTSKMKCFCLKAEVQNSSMSSLWWMTGNNALRKKELWWLWRKNTAEWVCLKHRKRREKQWRDVKLQYKKKSHWLLEAKMGKVLDAHSIPNLSVPESLRRSFVTKISVWVKVGKKYSKHSVSDLWFYVCFCFNIRIWKGYKI